MKILPIVLLGLGSTEDSVKYTVPEKPENAIFFETFDSANALDAWTVSADSKYEGGKWAIEQMISGGLVGDTGMVLKEKAKHHAIVKDTELFNFNHDLTVQYEVSFQSGIECGGAYMKLLTDSDDDITEFNDKSPFTIMFGPDKCGADYKYHFIIRYKNPVSGEIIEHSPSKKVETSELEKKYKDNKPHLFTLKLRKDSTFEMLLDNKIVSSGSLVTDMTPSIMPDKEIPDPEDSMPEDWDERERIEDPEAVKPDDWDESAPAKIPDASASMPSGWLVDQAPMIPDPDAVRPEDWDDDMDGEFEAPLIPNPECELATGCGEWEAPMINNPEYKGKWKPKMISNPDYKGKWEPRSIPNPSYFEDNNPAASLKPFSRIGFELWTLSSDIYFDNIIITSNDMDAVDLASKTIGLRKQNLGLIDSAVEATKDKPWLWAVYVLSVVIPVTLLIMCLCCGGSKTDDVGMKKKTDEPTPDDPHNSSDSEGTEEENEDGNEENKIGNEVNEDENEDGNIQEKEETEAVPPELEKEETEEVGDGDK